MGEEKTALVLSAGGMFGAYQAGVYQAVFEREPLDMVVGASVGALNGWLIASRCSPAHLIERWRDPAAGETLKLFPHPGWRNGWFDPAALRARAEQLWRDYEPTIPFGVVLIELPWMRTRLVQHPHVLPAHLHATCSIPLFLPPVSINGRRFLDGGFIEKLPLWAAIKMGATRIIAVDSLPDLGHRALNLGSRIMRLVTPVRRYAPKLDIIIISPSEKLGDANDAVFWKRENIERWIELGYRDGAQMISARPAAAEHPVLQAS